MDERYHSARPADRLADGCQALAPAPAAEQFSRMTQAEDRLPTTTAVIYVDHPDWVDHMVDRAAVYRNDVAKMRVAIAVARANVEHGTGGPFGAAIFEKDSGRLVSVGTNSVVRLNNSTLHAEIVAFMMAQREAGTFSLSAPGLPVHELFTSCEPCAMCLGATLWSGVRRVVYGAGREDASKLAFEEGPVFPASYRYLEDRGIEIVRDLLRDEARAVLELYRAKNGKIYNG